MKLLAITLTLAAIAAAATAADHPPKDHGGANLSLADCDVIVVAYTNINVFSVPGGAKASVAPFDGNHASPVRGRVTVHARVVIVAWELDATGAGYSGGGGGGGAQHSCRLSRGRAGRAGTC